MKHLSRPWHTYASAATLVLVTIIMTTRPAAAVPPPVSQIGWPMFGQNTANTAYNATEQTINVQNASQLAVKWSFTTGGDVSARPAVVDGAVYFPDWGGNFYKLNAASGAIIWSHKISDYDGIAGAVSRTSPAVDRNVVYIGDQNGAHLLAINAQNGMLRWSTQLDSHPAAIITQAPVVVNGVVYVGVSSDEEALAANPGYACCTFRGSALAVKASNGAILWKTYTVPDNGGTTGGYSGGAVWGSTAVVDQQRKQVYFTTGNNYTVPASVTTCETNGGTAAQCASPDDHIDSVLALDLNTGAIKWSDGQQAIDTWTVGCISTGANCPVNAGPDYDFGSGVNLITSTGPNGPQTILGAGQKSGVYWAINPDTGSILWGTQIGPGSSLGGIEWGSATDGQRIYVAISNLGHQAYAPPAPLANTPSATGGSWSALDPATGHILWQTADPLNAIDPGAVAVANGVVYGGSMDPAGHMYALNATNGTILWGFASGGSVISGAAIVNGTVYWGSGYSHLGPFIGTGNNKFYAFSLGGV